MCDVALAKPEKKNVNTYTFPPAIKKDGTVSDAAFFVSYLKTLTSDSSLSS